MEKEYGVMVYEILPDGCLNGVGSDTEKETGNKIFNEVARKTDGSKTVDGVYTTSYMNSIGEYIEAKLIVTLNKGRFQFSWFEKSPNAKYIGVGWKTRPNQLVVRYEFC